MMAAGIVVVSGLPSWVVSPFPQTTKIGQEHEERQDWSEVKWDEGAAGSSGGVVEWGAQMRRTNNKEVACLTSPHQQNPENHFVKPLITQLTS